MTDNKAWKDKFSFPFPLLSDEGRALPRLFEATTKRWAVLIDAERKIKEFWPEVVDKPGFAADALAKV